MWLLVLLRLSFPGNGVAPYVTLGTYPNRDACLAAERTFDRRLVVKPHIHARTACLEAS